jgi:hypothetical protein
VRRFSSTRRSVAIGALWLAAFAALLLLQETGPKAPFPLPVLT